MLYATDGILSYARFTEDEQLIAVFSMDEHPRDINLHVWMTGRHGYAPDDFLTRELLCDKDEISFSHERYNYEFGILKLFVPPKSVMLFYGN